MSDTFFSRVRLSIVAALVDVEWSTFGDLQESTGATKGNLGSHLTRLVAEGILAEQKRSVAGRQQTRYRLTARGRTSFLDHVAMLEDLLRAARREHAEAAADPHPLKAPRTDKVRR